MDPITLATFALLYLFHVALIVGFALGPIAVVLQVLTLKLLADMVLVLPSLIRFRAIPLLRHMLAFELFFLIYVLIFPPIVLATRTVAWKGRAY